MKMLTAQQQSDIMNDYARSPDASGPPPSINMLNNGVRISGPIFAGDEVASPATVGPLTRAQVLDDIGATTAQAEPQGALSQAAPATPRAAPPDIAEMLKQYMPQDDSQSRYMALAAGFLSPTRTGSFGEQLGNVASAMQAQRAEQDKMRAQYVPLIMQQVAQQQAREEQARYRLEAQQQAQQAQIAAQQAAQQARADQIAAQQQAINERAAADRASRESVSADRLAILQAAREQGGKAPAGYAWGPVDKNGQPTMIAVKGGPADLKIAGQLNADTQALTGSMANFDRLATAANEVLNHPGINGITGLRGKIPNIPGTDAANAEALLGTLKSQVGFGVLQDMRNNSKTGGALGSVSDAEGKRLESNLAALDKSQSVEQFKSNLKKVIDYSEQAKERMREAYNLKHGDQKAQASVVEAPSGAKPTDSVAAARAELERRKGGK